MGGPGGDALHGRSAGPRSDPRRVHRSADERWWILEDRKTGKFVGQCGLCPKELDGTLETELVYLVVPSRWGEGIASAAVAEVFRHARETFRVPRLIALIARGKMASEVVATRAGFRYTRDIVRPGGRALGPYVLEAAA